MQWILFDIPIGRNIKASDLKALKTIFDVEYFFKSNIYKGKVYKGNRYDKGSYL